MSGFVITEQHEQVGSADCGHQGSESSSVVPPKSVTESNDGTGTSRPCIAGVVGLAGFHRVPRGAEIALEAVATELAGRGHRLTLIGGGQPRPGTTYEFESAEAGLPHQYRSWPKFPPFREEESWAAAAFARKARKVSRRIDAQYGMTCSFPFEWAAIGARGRKRIFVTQNGDWPALNNAREYRLFNTDGLVCTNPEYYDRNKDRWRSALIPNGVDVDRFSPGPTDRERLGLPDGPLVIIVSALIDSKRVEHGLRSIAKAGAPQVAVFGNGVLADEVDTVGQELFGAGYRRSTLTPELMPVLYRSADLLVHMSQNESFGNIYIEAVACGLPVVAHRSSLTDWIYKDVPDRVHLVDSNSVDETSRAIADLLGRSHDELGAQAAATEIRSRFSWTEIGRAYDQFIRDVVNS